MDDWVIRQAQPDDERAIAYMWLRSLCQSRTARELGFERAWELGSDDQIAWWALNHPIVTGLLRSASVTVLCDPERSTYEPGSQAIIWGWLVAAGDVVYGCGIKYSMRSYGLSGDIIGDLLGSRRERPQVQAMELVDLRRVSAVPEHWTIEPEWWRAMRYLVQLSLERDKVLDSVVQHIGDPAREPWLPNSMRAA